MSSDDAVKVVVRVRPLNGRELEASGASHAVSANTDGTVVLCEPGRSDPYAVSVDCALGEASSQEDVYRAVGAAVVDHCMAGFNSSIFAYGQTGSGKTHTMLGAVQRDGATGALDAACGLIPRVFEALFAAIAQREQAECARGGAGNGASTGGGASLRYSVKCSFLEIYNEEVTDLLEPGSNGLQIRDGDAKRGVYVQGLSETEVLNGEV